MKRVIVGGISHETSTFTPVVTTPQSYHERFLLRGGEILKVLRGIWRLGNEQSFQVWVMASRHSDQNE